MDTNFSVKKILVPVDFFDKSRRALQVAADLATQQGAEIRVIHVIERHDPLLPSGEAERAEADIQATSEKMLADICRQTLLSADVEQELAWGSPTEIIVQRAEEWGADLIVMGTAARKGVSRLLLGSVAEGILRATGRPTLLLPEEK